MKNLNILVGEPVSISWDRFTSFLRIVPNNHINDESLKEYLYGGQDDNNKEVLDTLEDESYGECPYVDIAEKLEKISQNNKSWSTRKSDTWRNTYSVQSAHNQSTNEIREEIDQMRTKLGLVFKHIIRSAEKVNVLNYFSNHQPPTDQYY